MLPAKNLNSNNTLNPIGITVPIKLGNSGYFEQTFDTITQTKIKIFNLLNTKKGERRFQPLFGSRLQDSIFEQEVDSSSEMYKNIIIDDIKIWIPEVNILDIKLSLSNDQKNKLRDTYIVYVSITFEVDNTIDNVNLALQQNLI